MHFRPILKLCAAVLMVFGLALACAPDTVVALYKAEALTSSGAYYSMLLGGTFIAIAVVNWRASMAPALAGVAYVVLVDLLISCAGFVVALVRQLGYAATPPAGWLNVLLYFVFVCLFAYLQFGMQRADAGHGRRSDELGAN